MVDLNVMKKKLVWGGGGGYEPWYLMGLSGLISYYFELNYSFHNVRHTKTAILFYIIKVGVDCECFINLLNYLVYIQKKISLLS